MSRFLARERALEKRSHGVRARLADALEPELAILATKLPQLKMLDWKQSRRGKISTSNHRGCAGGMSENDQVSSLVQAVTLAAMSAVRHTNWRNCIWIPR